MNEIISSFVDIVIEQKKLQFSTNDITFDDQLFSNKILSVNGDKISIIDFQAISIHFILKYKKKFSFEISSEFRTNADFLNLIKKDFSSIAHLSNYYTLEKELWKYIIKESNLEFKCSYSEYLNEIKTDEVSVFMESYSEVLTELNLTEDEIFNNTVILSQKAKSEATYNIPLSNVLEGLKKKCKVDYNIGLKLLNKTLGLSGENENILSAIVSGLYEKKRIEFYKSNLKQLIQEEQKLNPILSGLASVLEITSSDCDLFIEIIKIFRERVEYEVPIVALIFSIIKSNNTKHNNYCFEVLKSAVKNENTALYILNNLRFLENYNQEKTDVIIELINQDYFTIDEGSIINISYVFWKLKEFNSFKRIVLSIIENHPFKKFIKHFQSYFETVEAIKLDEFVIELLIDNSASKRYIGAELFDELSMYKPYCFTYDILRLPPISQYKLWVSLTQDFHEPKERLTGLLPLIHSKSKLVQESFIYKLEEISEDYGGHVLEVLEDNLDKNFSNKAIIIDRIKRYIDDFYTENVDFKSSILEFNPNYTHYKYIKTYNELFFKEMRRKIDKGIEKNSLLSVLGTNTIQLAKGGGWRIGVKKDISQLGKVGSNLTMPRSYFINPNVYDIQKGLDIRQDWTDEEFRGIKIILEDE